MNAVPSVHLLCPGPPRSPWIFILVLLVCLLFPAPIRGQAPEGEGGSTAATGCSEMLSNGGFEVVDQGWETFGPAAPAAYTNSPVFAGAQAMGLGLGEGPNLDIVNGVRQTIFLPDSASNIVLGFRYIPVHESNPGDDLQYLDLYNAATGQKISRLWSQLANGSDWVFLQFDLTALAGQEVRIEFGVRNDGAGGRTSLTLDAVSLLACDVTAVETPTPSATNFSLLPSATPTPTAATPTASVTASPTASGSAAPPVATATALPSGCTASSLLQNGGFESDLHTAGGWILGQDPVPPVLSAEHSEGLRSLQMGNPPNPGSVNVITYSSVRQLVSIPATASTAQISWQHLSRSQAGADEMPNRWQDRHELILLEPTLETKAILWRRRANTTEWQTAAIDLTPYVGQTFYIYFNVFNDGDGARTWMYLDDVRLEVCFAGAATPTPTPLTTLTPTATTSPTPTPTGTGEIGLQTVEPPLDAESTVVAVGLAETPSSILIPDERPAQEPVENAVVEEPSAWQEFLEAIRRSRGLLAIGFALAVILLAVYFLRA